MVWVWVSTQVTALQPGLHSAARERPLPGLGSHHATGTASCGSPSGLLIEQGQPSLILMRLSLIYGLFRSGWINFHIFTNFLEFFYY